MTSSTFQVLTSI